MESERAREVQRMVEQLESLAEERILQGQADASRLRSLADDMARREAIRIERESASAFRVGGIFGGIE